MYNLEQIKMIKAEVSGKKGKETWKTCGYIAAWPFWKGPTWMWDPTKQEICQKF